MSQSRECPSFEHRLETAIYAAAFVDAFREMFTDLPIDERTEAAKKEAAFVVECFRRSRNLSADEMVPPP